TRLPARGEPLVRKNIPPPRPAPLQRPAARISVATKPKAAPERSRAVVGQPKAIPVRPAEGATSGTARGSAAKLPSGSAGVAPRPALPGAKRFGAAVSRATNVESKSVAAPPKCNSALPEGPSVQPSQLPHSRMRPPSTIQGIPRDKLYVEL
ncbi:hypothetical protein MTO96_044356, partial [Rhipicephalus appendiculatus]